MQISPAPGSRSMASRIRSIFSGSVGNLVEWYAWYVYPVFALCFAPSIFPEYSQTTQLLNTAAVFTVAIFGGTAEYVALLAKSQGVESWFYWYATACAAIALVVYLRMPDTRDTSRLNTAAG